MHSECSQDESIDAGAPDWLCSLAHIKLSILGMHNTIFELLQPANVGTHVKLLQLDSSD